MRKAHSQHVVGADQIYLDAISPAGGVAVLNFINGFNNTSIIDYTAETLAGQQRLDDIDPQSIPIGDICNYGADLTSPNRFDIGASAGEISARTS